MRRPNQLARQVGPIDGLREEEPQRRHDAVHGRRRHTGLALLDLELAHVIGRRRVRRAPQERREASDIANVVVLCRSREPAHVHVVDQTLTQWADGSSANGLVHWSAPSWLKKPRCPARSAALLNQSKTAGPFTKPVATTPLPRNGFVLPPRTAVGRGLRVTDRLLSE